MIYVFDGYALDRVKVELRQDGEPVPVEPQVYALLLLLVENHDRMVSRDEIVEKVWDGRIISESALDTRIKSARRAVGDDGRRQRCIRTIHGKGFRFVAEVREMAAASGVAGGSLVEVHQAGAGGSSAAAESAAEPSIAVLPFRSIGSAEPYAGLADALPDELIGQLSRLRWLFVIARGSSFRFRSAAPDLAEIGKVLGVRYCLSGSVELRGQRLAVTAQLVDTRDGGVVWGERFVSNVADVHATGDAIVAQLVSALELQIPLHEARRARLVAPENLDAWSAYHLGLQHMFRFNRQDNGVAADLFARAVAAAPNFARAHAGLSFVHFQNAFLKYTDDLAAEASAARRCAERSVELDPVDPFANLVMGRSFWLAGDLDASLVWLDRTTAISPNYAQGIYARAWTHALSGRGSEGKRDADRSMALSPLDPLHYAMSATRALSHIVCEEREEAAAWAEKAARSPGAHVLIAVIAAAAHALNHDPGRAQSWATQVRQRNPTITAADFFRSFPFVEPRLQRRIANALTKAGLEAGR